MGDRIRERRALVSRRGVALSRRAALVAVALAMPRPAAAAKSSPELQSECRERIGELEKQFKLTVNPDLLLELAACRRSLNDLSGAANAYLLFLSSFPNSERADAVRDLLAGVEADERRERRARQARAAKPSAPRETDSSAERESAPRESAPATADKSPPAADRLPGVPSGTAQAPANATSQLAASAPASPPPQPPAPADATAATTNAPALPAPPLSLIMVEGHPPPPARPRIWSYIAGGAGVVALGVGGGFGLKSRSTASEIKAGGHLTAQLDSLDSSYTSEARAADVLFAVGGGLLALSSALFVLHF